MVMLTVIAIANFAIAVLCIALSWRVARFGRQVAQLNRNLKRWTVLLEDTLAQHTLTLTKRRTRIHQWQLIHLQWQLHQRRLTQVAKFLRIVWLISKQKSMWGRR